MNLILLGAPGAGKGTQAEIISEEFDIPTLSTGAVLRAAIAADTELGRIAKRYIDDGNFVPDEVVIGIIKEYLSSDKCKHGFILDGFPRSIPQAEALDRLGVAIDAVLSIEVADDTIVERMSGRRTCTNCSATYHIHYNPSAKGDKCDKCGADLAIRKDDDPKVVQNRLQTYHEVTEPLKSYYAAKGCLIEVEGQEKLEDTTALTLGALKKFRGE